MSTQAVPITILRSWLPQVDQVNLFGRQIMASDLTQALRFLESQTAAFHTSRMKTVLLEKDQNKPTAYSDEGGFIVVSKLNSDDKLTPLQRQFDISTRQVFHEFEKLNMSTKGNTPGAAGSTGVSPAKSRVLEEAAENENNKRRAQI